MPEPGMRIPITVPGARQAAQDIASVGKAAGGAAAEQVKLEKSLGNLAASASRMRVQAEGVVARRARSPAFFEAQRVAGASREAREQASGELAEALRAKREQDRETAQLERGLRVRGPTQRLSTAQGAFAAAMARGDKDAAQDAEFAIARARVGIQRGRHQLARTGGGGLMDRAIGVLSSTRLNLGPVSPLVGQAAEALGVPAVGAAAAGIGAAGIALQGFVTALNTARDHLKELGQAARLTGGTGRDIGGLQAFGLRGGAAAGAAASFRERISGGDPFATMTAQQHGFFNLPRPFGDVNEAAGLRQALEYLRGIKDQGEQLRQARMLGLDADLKYINVSDRLFTLRQKQSEVEERLIQIGADQAANEFEVSLESLGDTMKGLSALLLTPTIKGFNQDIQNLIQGVQALEANPLAERFGSIFRRAVASGGNPLTFGMNLAQDFVREAMGQGEDDEGTKATRENTEAMERMTGVLKGSAGLGPRGERAIPPGWSGGQLRQGMDAGVIRRGQIFQ